MRVINLRKAGSSVMLEVPLAFLDQLNLQLGVMVGLAIEQDRLVAESRPRPRYTMAELLAASDYWQPQPAEGREWIDAPAVGTELL